MPVEIGKSTNWKSHAWVIGIASVSGASHGETVQITQVGNSVTSDSANIRSDLTGDTIEDLTELVVVQRSSVLRSWVGQINLSHYSNRAGVWARNVDLGAAYYRVDYGNTTDPIETPLRRHMVWQYGGTNDIGTTPRSKQFLSPITFSDNQINNGARTDGLLEVFLDSVSRTSNAVHLLRLVFDDTSTARPTGVIAGVAEKEWSGRRGGAAGQMDAIQRLEKASLKRELRKLRKKLRKARREGARRRVKKLQDEIRTMKR